MAEIAKTHHALGAWAVVMGQIRAAMSERTVHPSHAVVLVPYAQLIHEARRAWIATADTLGVASAGTAAFLPRFESTMNWARGLGGFLPTGDDLRLDAAFDAITARSLLQRAGLAEHSAMLAPKLMEAAWSLAAVAAAVAPEQRGDWGVRSAQDLFAGLNEPVLAFEAALGRIALAWVSTSAYVTDVLHKAEPPLLVIVDGFQSEPLLSALAQRLGPRCVRATLPGAYGEGDVNLHAATDFEDEAERTAACVLRQLNQGAVPVALVALDRQLTRRVRALLGELGVAIRDETGWKISTTRAAATLMSLLRASRWDASTDDVLDWLKNAPAFLAPALADAEHGATLAVLERELRKIGVRNWPGEAAQHAGLGAGSSAKLSATSQQLIQRANSLRISLQPSRLLRQWLSDLRSALVATGQWAALAHDAAGRAALEALGLPVNSDAVAGVGDPGRESDNFDDTLDAVADDFPGYAMRLTASEFSAWAAQTLEAANFSAPHPADAQVVILPLSQLLGRPLNAVVLAGCDEIHLPVSPEPPGAWTPPQRIALGLPTRADLAAALRQSWGCALMSPQLDVLWRTSEGGERCLPSGFVQELLRLRGPEGLADDPRTTRDLQTNASSMPRPSGQALPVARLSATAYEDLRRCPYRFFALRQLKLAQDDELDTDVDKRDFGNWLHRLLFHFQAALNLAPDADRAAQEAMINRAASQATQDFALSAAEFLPFAASWPRVRAGYLDWLAEHRALGNRFVEGEVWKEIRLGPVTLVGKLDRIDRQADGKLLVMDYKTESRTLTAERIKAGNEDTQLAFYAALIDVDAIAAAYVNVGEKDDTKSYPQPDIVALRAQLAEGILEDMQGIKDGKPMPAMGECFACDFCNARGLCRKDFWT
jgi:ATP-dependent helicase/nuclease subunit B